MSRDVHDLEDTVAEVDLIAVRQELRRLDRLEADSIRIEAFRRWPVEHGTGHVAFGDGVRYRRTAENTGLGGMDAAIGELVKTSDMIAMAVARHRDDRLALEKGHSTAQAREPEPGVDEKVMIAAFDEPYVGAEIRFDTVLP